MYIPQTILTKSLSVKIPWLTSAGGLKNFLFTNPPPTTKPLFHQPTHLVHPNINSLITKTTRIDPTNPQLSNRLIQPLLRILHLQEATSTRKFRDSRWSHFLSFCAQEKLPINEIAAAAYVCSLTIKPTSALTYLNAIKARLDPKPILTQIAAGFRRLAAGQSIRQATPISVKQMNEILTSINSPEIRLILWIAWKCAGRISEVLKLGKRNILQITPERVIISWANLPKSAQLHPFRQHLYTVIAHNQNSVTPSQITTLQNLCRYSRTNALFSLSQGRIRKTIQEICPKCTMHSLKRGAITWLLHLAANGKLSIQLLPMLAKHSTNNPLLPDSTIRYGSNQIETALALGTQSLTQFL